MLECTPLIALCRMSSIKLLRNMVETTATVTEINVANVIVIKSIESRMSVCNIRFSFISELSVYTTNTYKTDHLRPPIGHGHFYLSTVVEVLSVYNTNTNKIDLLRPPKGQWPYNIAFVIYCIVVNSIHINL